jgi:hypothetical protein
MSLKFVLLSMGVGLLVILVFCIGLFIAPTQWDKNMVGEWSNIQQPSRGHLFIRIQNNTVLVKEGGGTSEVVAKKDDSGQVLMIKGANGAYLYTLSMHPNGGLLGLEESVIRFCGDTAIYGKEANNCWQYKRVEK